MIAKRETFETIPIVDFGPAADGSLAGVRSVADEVRKACEQVGFLYIKNHSISKSLIDQVFKEATSFFALPERAKRKISIEDSPDYRGYIPFDAKIDQKNFRGRGVSGFQRHLDSSDLQSQPPNLVESFQIHKELPSDDPDVMASKPLHGPNQWPESLPSFRDVTLAYYEQAGSFAAQMLEVFAVGLGLDRGFFRQYYRKPLMQLRLLHYPPQDRAKVGETFGVRAHCDAGAFTMLLQDETGGLEVRNRKGKWIFAPPIEDTLVVNIGDMMKLWTNNRFESTPHRVINTYGADRLSIGFFVNPDYDAVIEPIPTCVDGDHPPVFEALHCGESILHTYSRIWPSQRKTDQSDTARLAG